MVAEAVNLLPYFLTIGAILFSVGLYIVLTRSSVILILVGIELMLNAANINFIAYNRYNAMQLDGHVAALVVMVIAAIEIGVALMLLVNIYGYLKASDIDTMVETI